MKNAKQMDDDLMSLVKGNIRVGVASMAGQGIMGSMANMAPAAAQPGMNQTANIVGSGLQLANIGMLAKTGMGLANMIGEQAQPKKYKK